MSIRVQLLAIALTTLILPWAGCRYARELEETLRISQENSLQAAADTIAHALAAQSERVFAGTDDARPFDWSQGDLYLYPLHGQPLLDGYREDWDIDAPPRTLPTSNGLTAHLQAGATEQYVFVFLDVDDPTVDRASGARPTDAERFDRVELALRRPDGVVDPFLIASGAPGPVQAQRMVTGDDGRSHMTPEPRIQAFWRQTSRGYAVEARIPRRLVGPRLWIAAIDGATDRQAGTSETDASQGGRLFGATPGLDDLLATFIGAGTRATVIDTNALKLGTAGSLARDAGGRALGSDTWYRRFVADDPSRWPLQTAAMDHLEGDSVRHALAGRPAAQWYRTTAVQAPRLSAAAPIRVGGRTRGAIVLEQAGDQLLDLRDRALVRLFYLTWLGTALAVAVAVGMATWIGRRIDRLRSAADSAISPEGRIRLEMPESGRADEIGALARGFERLLARLNEHTRYLRTLGGKLSHELRTPLTIVRSSLDNLESEGLRADQLTYVVRAREGVLRLQSLLSALGAASRVEESIKQAERVNFDLGDLLQSAVAGYRDAFRSVRIEVNAPASPCFLRGAPDLIVQMLDKLVENAVDFCAPNGAITVGLTLTGSAYDLTVDNEGAAIAPDVIGRLFESLFEHRQGVDDRAHFGLGLYIVRLIAEFHGGRASAENRSDDRGAVFSVILPLL